MRIWKGRRCVNHVVANFSIISCEKKKVEKWEKLNKNVTEKSHSVNHSSINLSFPYLSKPLAARFTSNFKAINILNYNIEDWYQNFLRKYLKILFDNCSFHLQLEFLKKNTNYSEDEILEWYVTFLVHLLLKIKYKKKMEKKHLYLVW